MSLSDLIPAQYRLPVLALILLLAGATSGWLVQGWRLGAELASLQTEHARQLQQIAQANADTLQSQQQARQKLETQLASLDQQRYQELQHAQQNTDRLSADLAAARQRLSVRITAPACSGVSATSSAPSLDNAAGTRAELYPETAAGVIRVAGEADQCRSKLMALQEWAWHVVQQ